MKAVKIFHNEKTFNISLLLEKMAVGKLILCFAVIFLLQQNVYGFNRNRIVNGSETPDGFFEFLPRLFLFRQGYIYHDTTVPVGFGICSSTIISKRHILTAAHCVHYAQPVRDDKNVAWNIRAQGFEIHYREKGKHFSNPLNLKLNPFHTRYYLHPSYTNGHTLHFDIAIIEFPEGTDLGFAPIRLASNYVEKEGDMAIAAGYGVYKWIVNETTGAQVSETPIVLQNATIPVHLDCEMPSVICTASYERYADEGDSGGPLMIERNGKIYQVGVTSFVSKRSKTAIRNGYTRVSANCDWISKVTKGQVNCEPLPDESVPQPSPLNPIKPNPQPFKPNNTQTKVPLNETAAVTSIPVPSKPEALADNSSSAFTFNIFLFLFIGILCFA